MTGGFERVVRASCGWAGAPRLGVLCGFLWVAAACSAPQARIDGLALRAGLAREVVQGSAFRHVLYRPRAARGGSELHVYIEGDGSPYVDRYTIAADPTPRNPVALELMSLDPAPVLYLGRPCYFGLARDASCNPSYWTQKRFSPEVIESLASVLAAEIARAGIKRVTLIGYSGGGAVALLLSDRPPAVDRVVTVAGNLDVGAWTRWHGYSPLVGSLDPMTDAQCRNDVAKIHYAGERDHNIPAAMIEAAAARLGGRVVIVRGFTHACCWTRIWPDVLHEIALEAALDH